ncbi:MAG: hypothetical protein HY890_02835 [Deltaproteobacteria bacterium]|nr:hypothetical protein [Deltaproteobacteria bacterium]
MMIYLGEFKAGDGVFYAANYHSDQGTLEDPTSPEAQIKNPAGVWTVLTAPAKQNAKTGHYGGTIDTTGFAAGQYIIRMAGSVTTSKSVATEFSFLIVGNTAKEVYDRVGAPAGASLCNDIAQIYGAIDTEISTILAAVTDKTGYSLSATGVDAILDEVVEGTLTLRQMVRIMAAALAGKTSGGGTTTISFTGLDGATTRITATVDANSNRTAATVNGN